MDTRSVEAQRIGRELAATALAWVEQNGQLRVRQREQLRRALASASELLSWATLSDEPVATASKDAVKLTTAGQKAMAQDMADELAAKKTELTQLKKASRELLKLADKGDFAEPHEFTYMRTIRDASGLATKVEVLNLETAEDASDASAAIDKKLEAWDKLRDLMVGELKVKQKKLDSVKSNIEGFIESSKGIIREVFATLY